tara:strand:+ start:929 stop:1396 length:468 start_codon:yes stop_codon:yes gene_type:complete
MMHQLSIALLLLGLAGCSYPSKEQAQEACDEWRAKQSHVTIRSYRDEQPLQPANRQKELELTLREIEAEDLSAYRDADQFRAQTKAFQIDFHEQLKQEDQQSRQLTDHQVAARWCTEDRSNQQVLGYENRTVIAHAWQNKQGMKGKGVVAKHFRY